MRSSTRTGAASCSNRIRRASKTAMVADRFWVSHGASYRSSVARSQRLAWDQRLPSLRDPKMSLWPRSRKPPPVRGAHRATSQRRRPTEGRATAPVRRRSHPEEKTASLSPLSPGGRTPTTLTRRLLGIGVTHVTAAPGRTDLRKKSPASRRGKTGIVHTGGIECVPSCDRERLTEMEGSRRAAIRLCGSWWLTLGTLDPRISHYKMTCQ